MKRTLFIVLIMFSVSFGCSEGPVAVVNGKKIDRETFDRAMKERMREHDRRNAQPDIGKLRQAVLEQLVIEGLMSEEAEKRGIRVTDGEVDGEVSRIRGGMGEGQFEAHLKDTGMGPDEFRKRTREKMVMVLLKERLLAEDPVTEGEVRDYYRNSFKPFIKPARMLVKMVEMDSEESARAAVREMRTKGVDFDEMADRLSKEGKATVINYGWVKPGFFSEALSLAIQNLSTGQYGGPYTGKKKFYIVRLKEREKEGIASFDEVKGVIWNTLCEEKREAVFNRWLEGKRRSSNVVMTLNEG